MLWIDLDHRAMGLDRGGTMARYFFHVDGDPLDTEGVEIESLAKAKCEAVKVAGTLICDTASAFWDRSDWKLTVTNEVGLTLFCLVFVGIEAPSTRAEAYPSPPGAA
jgi:hypothetical protein